MKTILTFFLVIVVLIIGCILNNDVYDKKENTYTITKTKGDYKTFGFETDRIILELLVTKKDGDFIDNTLLIDWVIISPEDDTPEKNDNYVWFYEENSIYNQLALTTEMKDGYSSASVFIWPEKYYEKYLNNDIKVMATLEGTNISVIFHLACKWDFTKWDLNVIQPESNYGTMDISGNTKVSYIFNDALVRVSVLKTSDIIINLIYNINKMTVFISSDEWLVGTYKNPICKIYLSKHGMSNEYPIYYNYNESNDSNATLTILSNENNMVNGEFSGLLWDNKDNEIDVIGNFSVPYKFLNNFND